jgi:putative transposase
MNGKDFVIQENQLIAVETLNVLGMIKNYNLAQSISGTNWGEVIRQLEYQALWYDHTLVKIDRWYPSSKCSSNF